MKKTLKVLLIVLVALAFNTGRARSSRNDELTTLRDTLTRHELSSVTVLRIPDNMDFYVAVTPQYMRELRPPTKKYAIEMTHSRFEELKQWVQQAHIESSEHYPDCRWGFLFMDRDGKEVASLFSDKFGKVGNVDGHNAEFSGPPLLDMIHSLVGPDVH
jgi:hypothetical protein